MNFKQMANTLIPTVLLIASSLTGAYELPDELTIHNRINSEPDKMNYQKLSDERIQFASGGFFAGALVAGPVGAFAGTVLGDLWGQGQEHSSRLEQQVSFWKHQALTQKNELALMQQKINEIALSKVSLRQVTPLEKDHLSLLALGLNSSIHFTTNSYEIEKHYLPRLKQLAYVLTQEQSLSIQLSGYSDFRGLEKSNQQLSLKRAERIKDYLIQSGIDSKRIILKVYGEQQPLYSYGPDNGRSQTQMHGDQMAFERRVDIRFIDEGRLT